MPQNDISGSYYRFFFGGLRNSSNWARTKFFVTFSTRLSSHSQIRNFSISSNFPAPRALHAFLPGPWIREFAIFETISRDIHPTLYPMGNTMRNRDSEEYLSASRSTYFADKALFIVTIREND